MTAGDTWLLLLMDIFECVIRISLDGPTTETATGSMGKESYDSKGLLATRRCICFVLFIRNTSNSNRLVRIAITIDVEEEGLFSGNYIREGMRVTNVRRLNKLAWLTREFNLPLTLLVNYPVAASPECAETLKYMHTTFGAEIGAHLHPWNTPPFNEGNPLDSATIAPDTIRQKLLNLTSTIKDNIGVSPVSFRMGRWDFSNAVRNAVAELGFKVDASVAPLKITPAGCGHFLSSADPYWMDKPGGLLEVPLTMVPIFSGSPHLAYSLYKLFPDGIGKTVARKFSQIGAVGIQPVWYSRPAMYHAAKLHESRGGKTLTMFFHSSELLPGGSPHFPTEASVERLMAKIRSFIERLTQKTELIGTTLSELHKTMSRGL